MVQDKSYIDYQLIKKFFIDVLVLNITQMANTFKKINFTLLYNLQKELPKMLLRILLYFNVNIYYINIMHSNIADSLFEIY